MKKRSLLQFCKPWILLFSLIRLGSPLLLAVLPCLARETELFSSIVKVYGSSASGSGVVVRSVQNQSLILTARHVVDSTSLSDKPYIQTTEGKRFIVNEIRLFENLDLAELMVTASLPIVRLSSSGHVGGAIRVVGFPQESVKPVLSSGPSEAQRGSSLLRPGGYLLIHGAPTTIGMSGGGVFNVSNELIGIHGQSDTTQLPSGRVVKTGYSLAIPIQLWLNGNVNSDVFQEVHGSRDLLARASYLRSSSRLQESLDLVTQALDLEPDSFTLLVFRASLYLELNQPKLALLDLDQIPASPNATSSASVYSNRGTALLMLKDFQGALEAYTAAIKVAPDLVDLYINKSKALQRLGRNSEALLSLDHAISLEQNSLNALFERAGLLREMKRYNQALADLKIYINHKPDDQIALTLAGALHSDLKNHKESYEFFRRAHAMSPSDPDLSINLAVSMASIGDMSEAIQMLRAVASAHPGKNIALANLSEILFSAGNANEACAIANKASQNGFMWYANDWNASFVETCGIILGSKN